jgi:hypothetical protein
MAEDGASTNGHRPPRRTRKHIYPPAEQMAAEQAASAARPRAARVSRTSVAEREFGPEATPPPAPPVMTMAPPEVAALEPIGEDEGIDADRVELRLSAVGMVDAGDVQVAQGALGGARAENVSVEQGALGAALATNVEVRQGYARSILARQVQLDRAAARIVVAADVRADRSAVMFLIARRVSGDVRVMFDWRGAIAFGAIAGLVMGLLRSGLGGAKKGSR